MRPPEPKTIVEDWAYLAGWHSPRDSANARTVLVDRARLLADAEPSSAGGPAGFRRPRGHRQGRGRELLRVRVLPGLSRREAAGLLVLVLASGLSWSTKASGGEPPSRAVGFSEPGPSELAAPQSIVSRLRETRRRREERQAQAGRAVARLVQEQRERIIAARAKEEALAQLRGRMPDPERLLRLRTSERESMEAEASSLLASGAEEEALLFYRALQEAFPDSKIYPGFVRVLEARTRCRSTARGGAPCS